MSAELASTSGEGRNTLLLYCPYDRRVTRHSRRGPANSILCVECGRRLEVSHNDRTAQIVPLTPPASAYSGPRSARAKRVAAWRRRSATPWAPFMLVGTVTVAALFALMTALGLFANPLAAIQEETIPIIGSIAIPGSSAAAEPTERHSESQPLAPAADATQLKVANTGGTGVYLRKTPNMNDKVRPWADGTALKILGPDTNENGVNWKHVQDPAGNQGYIPAEYTAPTS